MARRTKLSEELIKEAYELVASGNYIKDVYPILGIGEVTWYRWLREGEKAKSGLKREFWQAIKKRIFRHYKSRVSLQSWILRSIEV